MDDRDVIAHQARKIAELETKLAQSIESERQLLEMLKSAGITVTQTELSSREIELLQGYRRLTPEGKADVRAVAEREAEAAAVRKAAKREGANKHKQSTADSVVEVQADVKPAPRFTDLPPDFFAPTPEP